MPPIYSKEWKKAVVNMRGSIRQNRTSPCEITCPAGNNIQRLSLIHISEPTRPY